jgi:putative flippase GtrA
MQDDSHTKSLINSHFKDISIGQISKFGFVGILNTIVGYGAFILLLGYFNYIIAMIISHIVGVSHSYMWNRYWTFKPNKAGTGTFIRFNFVYLVVLMANAISLIFLVDVLKFDPRLGQLFVLPIILIISFFGHKYWSFGAKG